MTRPRSALLMFGPGLLVAATGVGAGDLAIGTITGSKLGVAILWAVVLGAALKFAMSEGLARWQIATGETLLEGALMRLARPVRWIFLAYLLTWSWFVGSALISACGVTTHALIPVFEDPVRGKFVFGVTCSLAGLVLVRRGGFRWFERCMRVCIVLMFVTVLVTAALLVEDWAEVAMGMVVPNIPDAGGEGITATIALIGGVGGTLTVVCYSYWIRETGQDGPSDLNTCRADLCVGYGVTALFGVAMVILGSGIEIEGSGAGLIVALANHLEGPLGSFAKWMFLTGAFGAVFSSLLGVWQSRRVLRFHLSSRRRAAAAPSPPRARPPGSRRSGPRGSSPCPALTAARAASRRRAAPQASRGGPWSRRRRRGRRSTWR